MLLATYSTNGVMVNTAILKCSALNHELYSSRFNPKPLCFAYSDLRAA